MPAHQHRLSLVYINIDVGLKTIHFSITLYFSGVQTDIERTDESEFIDITNFENTSFGNKLLEEFLHAGFADLKLGKYKPLPCWAGTHVGAGTNYACKECPAGKVKLVTNN